MKAEPIILSIIGMFLLFAALLNAFRDVMPISGKIFCFVLPAIILYSAFQIDKVQRQNRKQ